MPPPKNSHRFALLLACLCVAACGGQAGYSAGATKTYRAQHFIVKLPPQVRVTAEEPAPGVKFYDFHKGSRPLVFAYYGSKPQYPHFTWSPDRTDDLTLRSGLDARCRSRKSEGKASRECLVSFGKDDPNRLHIWYDSLNAESAALAEPILDSVAPRAP